MRLIFGCALVLTGISVVHATQTVFPIKACTGCSATQMQTSAKNSFPVGIGFIYDLHAHVLRKYEVYMDSTCGGGGPQVTNVGGGQTSGAGVRGGGSTECGSFKAADEMTPVDPSVQATFEALWTVDTHKAALAENGTERTYGQILDSHGQPFDLQQVAWDYPGGSYVNYANAVGTALSSQENANNFDYYLGDFLYGYKMSSFHVEIIITAPPGVAGSLSWDRNASIQLNICTPMWDDCSVWQVIVTNGVLSKTFLGIMDADNNIYPNSNGQTPGNLTNFGFPNGGHIGANHFADELRHHGINVPNATMCGPGFHPFLTTTRMNGTIIFQSWTCELD